MNLKSQLRSFNKVYKAMKTQKYAVIQIGYGCWGVGIGSQGAIAEALKWVDEESKREIKNLIAQFNFAGNDGDLILVPCSDEYAEIVEDGHPDVSYEWASENIQLIIA